MDAHAFLKALTVVLCVAAVTTVVFQRLRQSVVLGYLLAGVIIGPHVPIPLVADRAIVVTLSELGVILLMFSLGLELSLGKLARVGPAAGLTAIIQCSLMLWVGFGAGQALGWTTLESVFCGAVIAISSTTIIAKAFGELRIVGPLRDLVVGILIVEDLIAVLLMAVLTALSAGGGLSAATLWRSSGRLAAFLAGVLAVGLLVVPRMIRALVRLDRPETTLVASLGTCFALALVALELGYSVALGAFIAGSLIAESGEGGRIERLVEPLRDMFAAVFFVSVGMLIDPGVLVRHVGAVALLAALVVVGKVVSVTVGAFLTGRGTRTSVQAGMSLAQTGEFSFIIAGLGSALGATRGFLYPVAVAVSALTTLTTPWLIRASGPAASYVDRKLPRPLQTFAALYGSWLERLRAAPRPGTAGTAVRRLVARLALDAALLAAVAIGASVSLERVVRLLARSAGTSGAVARALVLVAAGALAAPFCIGIFRVAHRLGATLAAMALPEAASGTLDLAAAPRRALVVTLQLAMLLLVGAPLLAVTQPFLPGLPPALLLGLLAALLVLALWRSATGLQGHVRAGAEVLVEALAAQARKGAAERKEPPLAQLQGLLPGLGEPLPITLGEGSVAVGRTLAELDLRGLTGATVLAIVRGGEGVIIPTAQELLRAGDVLALAGTSEAVEAASALLGRAG